MNNEDKESILQLLRQDISYTQIQMRFSVSKSTLSSYVKKYEIPRTWGKPGPSKKPKRTPQKIVPNSGIFVENSPYSRKLVRRRIIKDDLFPYQCKCGCTGMWLGEPITLHLDHINGVGNDHRLSNLRFLCGNCHSQTSTWTGRNVRNKRLKDQSESL